MTPIQYDYYSIGTALSVPDHKLEGIKRSLAHDSTKLSNVLQEWFKNDSPPVTWETIIEVVSNPPIDNQRVARQIREYLAEDDVFKQYLD